MTVRRQLFSSFLDLYVISDLASNFGHIPSFQKGLTILVSRTKNLHAKIYDYEVMASSALNDVIERFEVVDKLNTKGLVDLYSSGLDIISSLHSLSIADPRIAELLAEPFDDPESKKERFLLVKIAELFELITKHVSNKLEEVFYYQVYSILFSLKLTQTVFTSRFLKEKIYEEDAEVFLLLCHALLNHKVFLCDLKENLSLLDIMLKMKSAFPKTVKDDQVKWFMEDAKEASKAPRVKMSAEATQIREIYPDLGSEFISKLLAYYKNNVQEVMIALLEENLPPQLASLDRTAEAKAEPEKPKLVIPGLYHKKAKTKRVDHAKEEEERQYIRKIAMNYQYTEDVEIVEVAEDETGAKYQTSSKFFSFFSYSASLLSFKRNTATSMTIHTMTRLNLGRKSSMTSSSQRISRSTLIFKRTPTTRISSNEKRKGEYKTRLKATHLTLGTVFYAFAILDEKFRPQSRSDRVSAPVSASAYYKQVWQEKHKNEKEPGGPPPPKGKLTEDATDLQKRRKDVNKGNFR